jgi:ribose 5-phosphate isomerase B
MIINVKVKLYYLKNKAKKKLIEVNTNKKEEWKWFPDYTLKKYKNDHGNSNKKTSVYLGADFAGFAWKEKIKNHLEKIGTYKIIDVGCYNDDFNDYPDFSEQLGLNVSKNKGSFGIAVCGSGIGIAIACNKIKGIRAATVHDVTTARLTREHNNANILAVGGWTTGPVQLYDIVDTFLTTKAETISFHTDRVDKITELENKYFK